MSKYEDLQAEHQRLLAQNETSADPKTILAEVQAYIERVKAEAEFIPDVRQRDQLRANLRYWASFVYDHTGAYPNTNLRPALQASEVPERPSEGGLSGKRLYLLGGGLVGLILLCALGFLLTRGMNFPSAAPPASEEPGGGTQPSISLTSISLTLTPSGSTAVPEALPTATLAPVTLQPTELWNDLSTQVARLTPTSPGEPLPGTGGGMVDAFHMASSLAASGAPAGDCGQRSLSIAIEPADVFSSLDLVAQVELSQGGQVVASAGLPFKDGMLTLDLPEGASDAAVLAQVDHPLFLFDSVIAQFSADCSRDRQLLSYRPDLGQRLSQDMPSDLQLRWRFLTWGPSLDGAGWIATLILEASGGDGSYIFWAEGDAANAGPGGLLIDNHLLVSKPFCDPAHLTLGVTSSGRTVRRQMLLQAPSCIEATPVATP